jgi:hypothetical protein
MPKGIEDFRHELAFVSVLGSGGLGFTALLVRRLE